MRDCSEWIEGEKLKLNPSSLTLHHPTIERKSVVAHFISNNKAPTLGHGRILDWEITNQRHYIDGIGIPSLSLLKDSYDPWIVLCGNVM